MQDARSTEVQVVVVCPGNRDEAVLEEGVYSLSAKEQGKQGRDYSLMLHTWYILN